MIAALNEMVSYVFIKMQGWRTMSKFKKNYGIFSSLKKPERYSFSLSNESNTFYGEIAKTVMDLSGNITRVFLPGENNTSKKEIRSALIKLRNSEIITAGLSKDVDYVWDFEDTPPRIGKFSLIISQAMLEHLVDPYKHLKDLSDYLDDDGYMIVHTELPGFMYHRHPVDTLRFHPDWFEEIAKPNRCNLKVINRIIRDFHIFYVYKKSALRAKGAISKSH